MKKNFKLFAIVIATGITTMVSCVKESTCTLEEKKIVDEEQRPDLEHGNLPDPEAKAISCLFDQIRALEKKVEDLTARLVETETKPAVKRTAKRATSTRSPAEKSGASTTNSRKKEKTEA